MKTTSYMVSEVLAPLARITRPVLVGALAILLLALAALGQAPAKKSPAHPLKKPALPIAASVPPPEEVQPPAPPPRPLTPEELPPGAPLVSWDGEQLTIASDNSTLADILIAVRAQTGAEIDIPGNAGRERVATRLGPGPAREVLSSLLSGTEFDYIIQASDSNELAVQSIILTRRSKGPGGPGTSVRGAILAAQPRRDLYQREPNPVAEDRRDSSEDATSAGTVAGVTPPDSAEAPGTPAGSQPSSNEAKAGSQVISADAKPAPSDAPSATSDAIRIQADLTPAVEASPSNNSQLSFREQKIQDMQSLFEQRRQMQEQVLKPRSAN